MTYWPSLPVPRARGRLSALAVTTAISCRATPPLLATQYSMTRWSLLTATSPVVPPLDPPPSPGGTRLTYTRSDEASPYRACTGTPFESAVVGVVLEGVELEGVVLDGVVLDGVVLPDMGVVPPAPD